MRVLRTYHAGRDPAHRARERAPAEAGVVVTLVVPVAWPDAGADRVLSREPFTVVELPVACTGDVNRHTYTADLAAVVRQAQPDLVDIHEEPLSLACRQWLAAAGPIPCVAYTAQNVDKRCPPPFARYERLAHAQLAGVYACSRQAASVTRGKGFSGHLQVIPLGHDRGWHSQRPAESSPGRLLLVGRLVPEKGVLDAIEVLAQVRRHHDVRKRPVGNGPAVIPALARAAALGVAGAIEHLPWLSAADLAREYEAAAVVLAPSRATHTWVEQFGRVLIEAHAYRTPVAGYASGAIPEVAGAGAALVPEGDVAALSALTLRLLEEPEYRAAVVAAGSAATEGRSWSAVACAQIAFYREAQETPAPRPHRRPVANRQGAQAEFGPPARLAGGSARPFALPILRRDTAAVRAVARTLDAVARR